MTEMFDCKVEDLRFTRWVDPNWVSKLFCYRTKIMYNEKGEVFCSCSCSCSCCCCSFPSLLFKLVQKSEACAHPSAPPLPDSLGVSGGCAQARNRNISQKRFQEKKIVTELSQSKPLNVGSCCVCFSAASREYPSIISLHYTLEAASTFGWKACTDLISNHWNYWFFPKKKHTYPWGSLK